MSGRLIFLLIISNTTKSALYLIYPITILAGVNNINVHVFCEAQGFLILASIEAAGRTSYVPLKTSTDIQADIAILVIALHAAVYILKAPWIGQGGLHPYRWYIYAAWICFPLVSASVAFVQGDSTYVSMGTTCYLPQVILSQTLNISLYFELTFLPQQSPSWLRVVLSWIPRYIIVGTILIAYALIYFHVKKLLKGIGKVNLFSISLDPITTQQGTESSSPGFEGVDRFRRSSSGACIEPEALNDTSHATQQNPFANWGGDSPFSLPVNASQNTKVANQTMGPSQHIALTDISPAQRYQYPRRTSTVSFCLPETSPMEGRRSSTVSLNAGVLGGRRSSYAYQPRQSNIILSGNSEGNVLGPRRPSIINFEDIPEGAQEKPETARRNSAVSIRQGPRRRSSHRLFTIVRDSRVGRATSIALRSCRCNRTKEEELYEVTKTRRAVQRAMRTLFIYPIIYVILWIIPFVNHCLTMQGWFQTHPDRVTMQVLTSMTLCIQSGADACVWALKERPWDRERHRRWSTISC